VTGAGFSRLRVERREAVLHVALARPEVHDAFDATSIAELTRAFREAAAEPGVRVVVLRSTGKSFCAGADLDWMRLVAAQGEAENLADAGRLEDMLRAVACCPRPVVARVQGAALGGGAGLVAACDVVVASSEAKLAFTEVRLGILPAVISPYVMGKLAPGRAQALFLTGETLTAEGAREVGLVHRVVAPAGLDAAVDEVVAALLLGSSEAQAAIKRLVPAVSGASLDDAREVTTRAIAGARASADGQEGMAAFLSKRKPRWAE
jgi:methylglutaconyl-CoA hydratase